MAQPTAQPTSTWLSPLRARALVMQRYLLSPSSAETLLLKWLDAEQVRWRYGHIKNDDGVPIEIALNRFWRPVGLSFNCEEGRAGRRVEPPPVAARGGGAPGGMVWASHPTGPTQPQRGNNVVLSDIEFAHEDIERRLAGYDEPAKPRGATEQWVYNRMKSD